MIQHDPKMIQDDGMTWYDFGMTWYDRQTLRYEPQDVDGSVWILHQGMDIHITGDGHPPISKFISQGFPRWNGYPIYHVLTMARMYLVVMGQES